MAETVSESRKAQYRAYLEAELEAAATYVAMAEVEKSPERAEVFRKLAQTEMRHASRWAEKLGLDASNLTPGSVQQKQLHPDWPWHRMKCPPCSFSILSFLMARAGTS